ncbi:hypothetical protein D9M68_805680 [compost metagenome]
MVGRQPGHAPGGPPQGHRERGFVPRQRHRAVPPARAPAQYQDQLRAQRQLLGQDRRQRGERGVHAGRQRFHPRGGLALGPGGRNRTGATARRRAHQRQRQEQGDARPRAAHHFPGYGPEARRAAVLERQGQEPVQGQACAPGFLPGDRHQRHPAHRHARCVQAHRAPGGPWHQRLRRGDERPLAVRRGRGQEAAGRRRLPERV